MTWRLVPAVLLFLPAACGSTPADANQVLRDASRAMGQVKTLQVDVTFGPGATVLGFDLVSAAGKVKRPQDSDTTGKVRTGGGGALIEPELVVAGGKTCLRQAQFLPYQEVTAADAASLPSAGRLLDPDRGVTAVLAKGTDAQVAGSESIDGHDAYRITATYTAAVLKDAVAPITPTGDLKATLWVDKAGSLVRRVRLTGKLFDATKDSSVDAHLHDFNASLDIPAAC